MSVRDCFKFQYSICFMKRKEKNCSYLLYYFFTHLLTLLIADAKMEFLNPGGSIKDRVAERMVDIAERTKIIKPGMTLIEPSSGNTGIGLTMVGAVKGYKSVIVMADKISAEKVLFFMYLFKIIA